MMGNGDGCNDMRQIGILSIAIKSTLIRFFPLILPKSCF